MDDQVKDAPTDLSLVVKTGDFVVIDAGIVDFVLIRKLLCVEPAATKVLCQPLVVESQSDFEDSNKRVETPFEEISCRLFSSFLPHKQVFLLLAVVPKELESALFDEVLDQNEDQTREKTMTQVPDLWEYHVLAVFCAVPVCLIRQN